MPARRAPQDLGAEGRALWLAVQRWMHEQQLIADPHERPLLDELARTSDRLATLRTALAGTDVRDAAWTRLASEERQQRLAYGRLVSSIGLPTGAVPDLPADKVVNLRGLSARSRPEGGQGALGRGWGRAMRRVRPNPSGMVDKLLDAWRDAGDPRLAAHERGEPVLLSVTEVPGWPPHQPNAAQGFADDLELTLGGELRSSMAYFSRRLAAPLPYRGEVG